MKKMFLAILAILVVAGLSFGAWQYLQKEDQKPAQNNQTANDPSEGGKYLVINDWNIKIEVPEILKNNLYYEKSTVNGFESIRFNSSAVDLINCAPISVARSKEPISNQKLGEHYLEIITGPAACDLSTAPRQQIATDAQIKLKEALTKAVLISD